MFRVAVGLERSLRSGNPVLLKRGGDFYRTSEPIARLHGSRNKRAFRNIHRSGGRGTYESVDESHSQAVGSFVQVHYKDGTHRVRVIAQGLGQGDGERKATPV